MKSKLSVSLCMIVKNEEEYLDRCLNSVQRLVDEIIIVDTGSTDRTKEICRKHSAKIFDFVWTESFAEARNFGINKAEGEWIFWIDADEEVTLKDAEKFRNALESEKKDIFLIPLINYYGTFPADINKAYLYTSQRLFRNYKGVKFIGNIHEHLNVQDVKENFAQEIMPYIEIHHYGYMDSVIVSKNKHERNIHILKQERKHPDYNPWIDYHIASEDYYSKRYEQAFRNVNLSILRFLQRKQFPPSLLYKLKYDIMLTTGSFEEAWPGIEKAITLYPEYVDLHFYKGIILFEKKMFEEAILVFKHCIELGETQSQHLTLIGCGGYRSWYFIGRCYESLGEYQKAISSYAQSLKLYPHYSEAESKLEELIKNQHISKTSDL